MLMSPATGHKRVTVSHFRSTLLNVGIRVGRIQGSYSRDLPGYQLLRVEISTLSNAPAPAEISPAWLITDLKGRFPSIIVVDSVSYETLRWTFKVTFDPNEFLSYYPTQ